MMNVTTLSALVPFDRAEARAPQGAQLADNELQDACQQFEALLINQVFTEMRRSIPEDGFIQRSQGEQIFQGMLDSEFSQQISRTSSLGLAEMLYRELAPASGVAMAPLGKTEPEPVQ